MNKKLDPFIECLETLEKELSQKAQPASVSSVQLVTKQSIDELLEWAKRPSIESGLIVEDHHMLHNLYKLSKEALKQLQEEELEQVNQNLNTMKEMTQTLEREIEEEVVYIKPKNSF